MMRVKHFLAASAFALGVGLAYPALAQVTEAGPGSADDNITGSLNDNELLSRNQDNDANGNNRDNDEFLNGNELLSRNQDNDGNGDNRDNDDNGNNRDNENYGDGNASRGGEISDNGNNRDNENYGDGSASRGGEVSDNGNNRENESYGDGSASRGGEAYGDGSASRGGNVSDNGNNRDNGNATVVATQVLAAVITNEGQDSINEMEGTEGGADYRSGDNRIGGGSFAAFAGILNQVANSGFNANNQSATNIAANGAVTFNDTTP
jgi:hypothetical protein